MTDPTNQDMPVAWMRDFLGDWSWTVHGNVADGWRNTGSDVTPLYSSEQFDRMRERAERADGEISIIAQHLDAEPDSDSILHLIREAEADRDILKAERDELRKALEEIFGFAKGCVHDGGFDREIGPIGCLLGDKCVCMGFATAANLALAKLQDTSHATRTR